jgi:hypothetical protein
VDKIDNESVESSNCDSFRIDNSPSDDIEKVWVENGVCWFVEIGGVLFKRSVTRRKDAF